MRVTTPTDGDGQQVEDARVVRTRGDVSRAALRVLAEQGAEAVTHAHLAQEAGYSRATLYKHWPARADLFRLAFARLGAIAHPVPTGDVRADLVAELGAFRSAVAGLRLDRAVCALVDLAAAAPELRAARDRIADDGERVVRRLLAPQLTGPALDAATAMLCGAVLHAALLHGAPAGDDVLGAAVDLVLDGSATR